MKPEEDFIKDTFTCAEKKPQTNQHLFSRVLQESLQTAASGKETELKTQLSELMSSLKSVKEKLNLAEVGKILIVLGKSSIS